MNSLPPEPKIKIDSEAVGLINRAERHFISIAGILSTLPQDHPAILHTMLNETINNLLIDGIDIGFSNIIFKNIADPEANEFSKSVDALELGIRLLKDVPKASHIIKSIHQKISGDMPARFRIHNREYFPRPENIDELMNDLDNYVLNDISYPVAVNAALIHAQFEMIRPFDSYNGLVGRMLAQLHFIWKKRTPVPVLQLSSALLNHKHEYFERLNDLTKNNRWEEWIRFFLTSIVEAGELTESILKRFLEIERRGFDLLIEKETATTAALRLYKYFLSNPLSTVPQITEKLKFSKQTANLLISKFLEENIIDEATGKQRNRVYVNKKIIDLFENNPGKQ